ncbi:galactoside-binding lectin [Cooperia oncophora]
MSHLARIPVRQIPKRRTIGNISGRWTIGSRSKRVSVKRSLLVKPFTVAGPVFTPAVLLAVGTLSDKPVRVDFNFHKGAAKDADLPLHFSIRFDEGIFSGKFVYNTFKDGNWSENEQRISNPFKAGQEFDLRVRILEGKFQVFANRAEVGTFEQRQPLDGIDHVSIRGDLVKLRLFHYGGRIFPNPYMAVAELKPGKRLDISALPTGKRVNINLYRENKEFALQVSIRFNEGAIVRNAMNNNVWGKEERDGNMPISKGEV